ncbi:hypothetical protein WMY93_024119 [Mugilogobius chulae]|uniref:Serine/threonine-protein phosphatase 6 regulatory subunit 2 n=1 Tax=Mugilogobius chulae TaxID=88201 RepID=A0AAW0N962_9GOBI
MFWKFDLHTASHLEALLDQEDVSLSQLLEEEDVLQECKAQNRRLLLFLCKDQSMQELVRLITTEPPAGGEETKRFKYSNIACELLTCDVGVINDKLGNEEPLLETLYSFLEQPPPLNPLLASFFSKTIGNLIARKTEQWLNEEKLAQRLIELIHPEREDERQSNASQTLCDIIRLSRDQANQLQELSQPDPLLTVLESVDGIMDAQGFERSYLVNSSILLAIEPHLKYFHQLLLEPPKKSPVLTSLGVLEDPLGNTRLHVARLVASLLYTSSSSHAVVAHELCRLNTMDLLLDLFFKYTWNNFLHLQVELCVAAILRPCAHEMKLQPILGSQDKTQTEEGPQEPSEALSTPKRALDQPENSAHNLLMSHLFQHCHLVQRILEAWEENDKLQSEGGMRKGYMGHLTRIANTVVHNLEKGPVHTQISHLISELPEDIRGRWETFVEHTLTETNRKNTTDLVGSGNPRPSSEDDMESPFPKELTLQQSFSDYQIQQMTADFVDQFGFNDEEFTDHDDNIGATFDRIAEISINIDSGHDSKNSSVFEACSKDRIQPFDDDEEDIWEDKEINYATQTKSRNRFGGCPSSQSQAVGETNDSTAEPQSPIKTTDSDSEDESKDNLDPFLSQCYTNAPSSKPFQLNTTVFNALCMYYVMVLSSDSAWIADFGEVNSTAPLAGEGGGFGAWDTAASEQTATNSEEKGWANFTDFQPFCCSETGPRCSSPVDSMNSGSEGTISNQNPCGWSVCVPRKAPLVASDSSSSSSSDTDEDEAKAATKESISTGAGKETLRLSVDPHNQRALFSSEAEKMQEDGDGSVAISAPQSDVTLEMQPSANGPA